MEAPTTRDLRGKWRRWLFRSWVAASAVVALYVGIAGPFADYFREGQSLVALAVPALMFFFLATGLGWLVLLVTSKPPQANTDDDPDVRWHPQQ